MNTPKLMAAMALKKHTVKTLCTETGISTTSFYRKISGETEFTQGEISSIISVLGLTNEEAFAIFFADEVEETQHVRNE